MEVFYKNGRLRLLPSVAPFSDPKGQAHVKAKDKWHQATHMLNPDPLYLNIQMLA